MKNVYTKLENGVHVLTDPQDLSTLELDSCVVARKKGKLYIRSLESLQTQKVEEMQDSRYYSDPVFHLSGEKPEKFLVINGERKNSKFCDLCKDRLNGITGNCFNRNIKPSGCSFTPAKTLGKFKISLDGWQFLKPSRVNSYSPFKQPWNGEYVSLESKLINRNKRAIAIRSDYWNQLKKKQEKYCSRCVYEGRCYMNSVKIAEHCMVTEEKIQRNCLRKIQSKFGTVEDFLNRLSFAGGKLVLRPSGEKRKTQWLVTKPVGRNKYLIRKRYKSSKLAVVSRSRIEKLVIPEALPWKNREKTAALAWYFFEKYCAKNQDAYRGYRGRTIRIRFVTPIPEGIEVSYFPYGWGDPRPCAKRFRSFNEILKFER